MNSVPTTSTIPIEISGVKSFESSNQQASVGFSFGASGGGPSGVSSGSSGISFGTGSNNVNLSTAIAVSTSGFGSSSSPTIPQFGGTTALTNPNINTGANVSSNVTTAVFPVAPQNIVAPLILTSNAETTTAARTTTSSSTILSTIATTVPSIQPLTNFSLPTNATTTVSLPHNQQQQSSSIVSTPLQLNFCQLEENINKWTLELEEQEKNFMNQATQINAWDKVLLQNSNKINELSEIVEKVKADQQTLEHELEYIAAQHIELDECITPLQIELTKIPDTNTEKAQTYLLTETLDTHLKQMSEDLKEIIEHLNEASQMQDSNDPIVQIGRILNAHMSSLQWIESSTSSISKKLVDVSKMYDVLRKDNEKSFRLAYND